MLKAIVIATAIGLAAPTYAQVRVITGDVEHVYGPGGEISTVRLRIWLHHPTAKSG
jgi:hypothetical protein